MAAETTPRPSRVTSACLMAGAAAVLVLIQVIATLSDWGSLEVREQIEDTLGATPVDVSVDDAMGWLRVALMGIGALAAAAVVLAVFTAKRHNGARIGLTIVAGLSSVVFAAAGLAGILPAVLGVVVILFLWGRDSRAWFAPSRAGGAAASSDPFAHGPPSASREDSPPPPGPQQPPPSTPPALDRPRGTVDAPIRPSADGEDVPAPSTRPYAAAPGEHAPPPGPPVDPQGWPQQQQPPPGGWPPPQQPPPGGWPPPGGTDPYGRPGASWVAPTRRTPRQLVIAVVISAVTSGLVALVLALNVVAYLASPTEYARLIAEQPMVVDGDLLEQVGMAADEFARLMLWLSLGLGALALVGLASALWMLTGKGAARITFTVVTGIAIAASALALPLGAVFVAVEVVCLVLIWRGEVNAWFASRSA